MASREAHLGPVWGLGGVVFVFSVVFFKYNYAFS